MNASFDFRWIWIGVKILITVIMAEHVDEHLNELTILTQNRYEI